MFMYSVVLPEMALRLVCLGFWKTRLFLNWRVMILEVTAPCLYTGWLIYAMYFYKDFTPACYEPYPSFSIVLFTIEMVLILPAGFLVICLLAFLVLFSPFIIYTMIKAYRDERKRIEIKEKVVSSLAKVSFGRIKLEGQVMCAICLGDF